VKYARISSRENSKPRCGMHSRLGATPKAQDNRVPEIPSLLRGTTGAFELLCLLTALLFMAACGRSGSSPSNGPVSHPRIKVSCNPKSIHTGETSQCTATDNETGSAVSSVDWSVNGVRGGNSTVGTISSTGLYTAPRSVPKERNFTVAARVGTLFNGSFAGVAVGVAP